MRIEIDGQVVLIDEADVSLLAGWSWHIQQDGRRRYVYARSRRGGGYVKVYLHRLILGARAGRETDHVNGDGLDNRRVNLRACTSSQNQANTSRPTGQSGTRGVTFSKKKKWEARISVRGRRIQLGTFSALHEAAAAYARAAREHFGEFTKA